MGLDLSGAIELAKELLSTGRNFRDHDQELAAKISARAYEICDEFGIDRALVDPAMASKPDQAADEAIKTSRHAVPLDEPEPSTDAEPMPSTQRLCAMLDRHTKAIKEQAFDNLLKPASKKRFSLSRKSARREFGHLKSA